MRKFILFIFLLVCTSFTLFGGTVYFGMSSALTGPAGALGRQMERGINAYFQAINKQGGVNGNQLKLKALDDAYEPGAAASNMLTLVKDPNILAVVGNVGTPTAIVTVPIANENHVLLFGAYTGAQWLRKSPPDRYVINYRAAYAQETAQMVKGLLSAGIKPEEMAFFTQNDGYGDDGYRGAIAALKKAGFAHPERLPHGRYTRNTAHVEQGLTEILSSDRAVKAFIIVGAYNPVAKFIQLAQQDFPHALFLNVSFVSSEALRDALCASACQELDHRVIVTQVVPHYRADLPAAKDYLIDLRSYDAHAKPSFTSFEGYLVARLLVAGLQRAGAHPTREGLVDALEALKKADIGIGLPVSYSKQQHQAIDQVWATVLSQGQFVPFDWESLK